MRTILNPFISTSKTLGYDSGMVDTGDMYGNQPLEQPTVEVEITELLIEDITVDEACDIANSKTILVKFENSTVWVEHKEHDWEANINEFQEIEVFESKITHDGPDTSIVVQTCFTVYAV